MTRVRRLLLLALALGAIAGIAVPRANAANPCFLALPQTLTSAHFLVSYDDDPKKPDYMSQTQAGQILATAERAYTSYTAMGFPAPTVEPSSGKTEFYIADLSSQSLAAIYCHGGVDLDGATMTASDLGADYTIASVTFDQVAYVYSSAGTDQWLFNGTGGWAAWHALGYPAQAFSPLGPYDMSLDCDSASDKANCDKNGYINLGDSRWPFYEYLVEKYSPTIMSDIFNAANVAPGHDGLTALQDALAAKGTTLSAEYGAYTAKLLSGGWTATPLNASTVPVSATIQAGAATGAIPTASFGVSHLATKFVEIDRGDGDGSHACYSATLNLTVQIPAGVTSQPTFYWSGGGSAAVPLSVSGSTATATVPWDTCKWSSKGILSLPNTSLVNGQSFTVSGQLTVDTTKPTSSSNAPAQSSQYGQTVDASSVSSVPDLSLFGPSLLKLSSTDTKLRLIVQSDGDGSVTAALGSTKLGTLSVRAGGNDLRFSIPASMLQTLRRSAGDMTLTLTPVAPDGTTKGTALTRKVTVATVKPKVKLKAKVKKHTLRKR